MIVILSWTQMLHSPSNFEYDTWGKSRTYSDFLVDGIFLHSQRDRSTEKGVSNLVNVLGLFTLPGLNKKSQRHPLFMYVFVPDGTDDFPMNRRLSLTSLVWSPLPVRLDFRRSHQISSS